MRKLQTHTIGSFLLGFVILASGCGPKYPACKKDEDCNKDKPRNEYCVNQMCQQCRGDQDCTRGQECKAGACTAIENWCEDDSTCPPNTACIDNRCRACTSDAECGEGGKCKQGRCLRKGRCDTEEDCAENQVCENGYCVAAVKPAEAPPKECVLDQVFFDFNEYVLTTEATDIIDKNVTCAKQIGRPVQLVGHADPRGTEEYNMALSERRAQSVRDRLIRLGVDKKKLSTLPKGELEATGTDESGWAHDRRVDFNWK